VISNIIYVGPCNTICTYVKWPLECKVIKFACGNTKRSAILKEVLYTKFQQNMSNNLKAIRKIFKEARKIHLGGKKVICSVILI